MWSGIGGYFIVCPQEEHINMNYFGHKFIKEAMLK
jgi:hypothetical protein